MQLSTQGFKSRKAPLGFAEELCYERALLEVEGWQWVVLREARGDCGAARPVLTSCFEYIANAVRAELVHLQGGPDRLRFFHCQYEMLRTGLLQWSVKEVLLMRRDGLYVMASWASVTPESKERINAALNLCERPLRTPP